MQLTLVQVEIEEAIRAYVNEQINVREGMRIDIDLKATRGAEGYQAFIDIVPETTVRTQREPEVQQEAEQLQTQAPVQAPKAVAKAAAPIATTRRKIAPVVEPEVQIAGAMTAETSNEVEEDTDRAPAQALDAEPDMSAEAGEPTPVPVAAPRSLFGGLTRPNNS